MSQENKNQPEMAARTREAADQACRRIAPAWPLDKSIAVNPWWEMRHLSITDVAAKLKSLSNVNLLMPKSYYQSLWQAQIKPSHLALAAREMAVTATEVELVAYLYSDNGSAHWSNMCDLLDADPSHDHKMPWRDEIVQQISQFTALYFQYPEQMQYLGDTDNQFYRVWLDVVRQDKGIEVLMSESGLSELFSALPENPETLFDMVHQDLFSHAPSDAVFTEYCYALLLDIHGWASWLAYGAWQDAFDGKSNSLITQLLAVRMAWDWVLWRLAHTYASDKSHSISSTFARQVINAEALAQNWHSTQQYQWVWQRALEYAYQQPLQNQLLTAAQSEKAGHQLQAIFCIDVRSEPMRRALEAQSPLIQTRGFAGFFGLPIEYSIAGSQYNRPQLPGLLKAAIRVEQTGTEAIQISTAGSVRKKVATKQSSEAAPSAFGFIEANGLYRAATLVRKTFFPNKPQQTINQIDLHGNWQLTKDGRTLSDAELASLCAGILGAMGLQHDVTPTVLLIGHGSSSTNNPHAAGLDCGACGGQSGEVNVKVLAQVLNTAGVRTELLKLGVTIPATTQFVPCLHNTTTDEIICFNGNDNQPWKTWLDNATAVAQAARAGSVGIVAADQTERKQQFEQRANDWAQVRPEWGLANNASFIVAPRAATQGIDLGGRSFLHDYRYQDDTEFSVLELIITAPMVVTNWINLQYFASVTDNLKYGSGNKLLHNVVGGNYGVFEGNGGDLRIGLSMQSVHDGEDWRHHPLRLSVYLAAPRDAIVNIVTKHQAVADLINNDWLYLFQWDTDNKQIWRLYSGKWQLVQTGEGSV